VFLTDDKRIALLDLGQVGHTTPAMQENLLKLLLAINEDKSEEAADLVIRISQKNEEFDPTEFRRHIGQLMALRRDQPLKQLKVGQSLMEISRSAAESGLYVPSELTLLGKTLLQLDEVGKVLDPNFNPNEVVRQNVSKLMSQRMAKDAAQGRVSSMLLEIKDFMAGLPGRLNGIMDAVANAELEIKVKAVDAEMVVEGIEKVANRITTGIVLAALIIGAALLMRVETPFRLFGYPGLAMLLFLAAVAGGFYLVVSTFVRDAKRRKVPR
jgi:predicted unusual protein kinase regulating ubiquinone biosynthesis (AarF/ABC1/UbiB family)